jgi:uncharacterized membrane protein
MTEERFYLSLLSILAAITAAVVALVALGLHRNFLTIACDTAVLQSGIVNTLHGHWFETDGPGGPSILSAHTTFLLLLVIPIYVLAPSPDTLFVLQIIGVYSTVIPLYLVALEILKRPQIAFGIALIALASPLLVHMAFAPFHLETWIAAAVLWSYLFYLRNVGLGFAAAFFFAVCCGEQAALIYIALGMSLIFFDDGLAWRKPYGRAALLAGLTWVILDALVVVPLARGSYPFNIFSYNYAQWGIHSPTELPRAVLAHPGLAFALLASPSRWIHVGSLMGLPLIMALFSRRSVILLAPFPLFFLMSDQEFFLYFHAYYYTFAFVAGYLGLILFLARPALAVRVVIVVMTFTLFFNMFLLCPAAGFYLRFEEARDDAFSKTLHQVFETLPPEAGVYTPHRYSAYLSNRQVMVIGDLRDSNLYFKVMMDAQYNVTHVHPEQIDFIVCDILTDQCGWRLGYPDADQQQARRVNVDRLLKSGQWKLFWGQSDVFILQRVPDGTGPTPENTAPTSGAKTSPAQGGTKS